MRIVIDLQGMQSGNKYRGIGRYIKNFVTNFLRHNQKHEIILLLNGFLEESILDIKDDFSEFCDGCEIRTWFGIRGSAFFNSNNSLRRELAKVMYRHYISELEPDILFFTSVFEGFDDDSIITSVDEGIKTAAILYDLIPYTNPKDYLEPNEIYKCFYLEQLNVLNNCNQLLSISDFSRREGESNLSNKLVIHNISTAADEIFSNLAKSGKDASNSGQSVKLLSRLGVSEKFILTIGGADKRKNLIRLIEAYSILPDDLKRKYKLIFAGNMPRNSIAELEEKISAFKLDRSYISFLGYVTDQELITLYRSCDLYVFPSWHEGFGLPALEAMLVGAPVIASNTASLPEVLNNDNALFDPFDVFSISNKIKLALSDDKFKKQLLESAKENVKKFDWRITVERSFKYLEKLNSSNAQLKKESDKNSYKTYLEDIAKVDSVCISSQELIELAASSSLNNVKKTNKCIYIDVSNIVVNDLKTGIQRVVRNITNELLNIDQQIKVIPVYLTKKNSKFIYRTVESFCSFNFGESALVEPKFGDVFLGLDLCSDVCDAINAGVFHNWRRRGVAIHFVVYDILPITNPEWWPNGGGELHTKWLNCIAKVADSLIAISKSVSDSISVYLEEVGYCRKVPLKLLWFHLGADIDIEISNERKLTVVEKEKIEKLSARKTFLVVGTLEPRKGHAATLKSFERLWHEKVDVNLVFVGKEGWMVSELVEKIKKHPELGQRFYWFEGVSDAFLKELYKASSCLLAASEGEGFGLPLIEAAQYGLPLLVRDIPVFHEVAGENACYFDNSESGVYQGIRKWIALHNVNEHPKSSSISWLTWQLSASKLNALLLQKQ